MNATLFPVILILSGIVVLWVIVAFNGLVTSRNRAREAWSDIEVQLKRRYDLIPNLVNTVKGYAKHEEGVFREVTEARTRAMSASSGKDHAQAEAQFSGSIMHLLAVAESYPDLKASDNFGKLQSELVDAEDKIQAARRFYNGQVRDYNTKLQVFPTNMFGSMLGFAPSDFFDAPAEASATPNVQF